MVYPEHPNITRWGKNGEKTNGRRRKERKWGRGRRKRKIEVGLFVLVNKIEVGVGG